MLKLKKLITEEQRINKKRKAVTSQSLHTEV